MSDPENIITFFSIGFGLLISLFVINFIIKLRKKKLNPELVEPKNIKKTLKLGSVIYLLYLAASLVMVWMIAF